MPTVLITSEMRKKAHNFASNIISGGNQYDRLPTTINERIGRTFAGKLAEYAFLHYLRSQEINYSEGDMFEVFEGQENVDGFDFETDNGRTIDIKCASKPFHSRIMVPIDQFNSIPKDYYIGIKLHSKLSDKGRILTNSITKATISGYCTYKELDQVTTKSFGEGACKHKRLDELNDIETIINMF
ncbi:hypothetical protein JCM16358_25270 [Halanaerocella petrolearia]